MNTPYRHLAILAGAACLVACGGSHPVEAPGAPLVMAASVTAADGNVFELSGVVRARQETPLAFRLPGEIRQRLIKAGDRVKAGQVLMLLDPRDVEQQLTAARTQAENAQANRQRLADLRAKNFISQQAYDNAATAAVAAQAAMAQAINATGYTRLTAPAAGILMEVNGEVGQVVAAGQAVATLAYDGDREIEVFVPETRRANLPTQATAHLFAHNATASVTLREIAGAADPLTRTWRARYLLDKDQRDWPLGATASLRLDSGNAATAQLKQVPIAAILDQGHGPTVLAIHDGKAAPAPVQLVRMDTEHAYITTELPVGTQVVALGPHLIKPGQAVKTQ
uniref:Multidrug efflux system protein n=1 Tax=uncultured bacterium UPO46 TaxID=1776971 RepID=A0A126SY55_9BACT|nr:multidrug efflux system protein [uncultured bacterium UPO46]